MPLVASPFNLSWVTKLLDSSERLRKARDSVVIIAEEWKHAYTRNHAAFPLPYVRENKFWPSVARVNNTHGDRNLICTCEPVSSYAEIELKKTPA